MDQSAENLVTTAYRAGAKRDQVETFLRKGYIPLPWQWRFHALAREADEAGGPTKIGTGGARGPGKSHAVFSQVTLDDCPRVDNLKCLFLRQTGAAAQESFEDLVLRVLTGRTKYEYTRNVLYFPNGSRVVLGGFHNSKDIDKYIGIEYDLITIEEINQLSRDKVDKLLGSMRTSKPNWRPRLYASFNPGGIGHGNVKEVFVDPYYSKTETKTRFVPSTYKENPYLNEEYIDYLEDLGGDLGRAWREGDFSLFFGQYFDEWRNEKHVISPLPIPVTWRKYVCIDYGRTAAFAAYWVAIDYEGRAYVYREYYVTGKDARPNAEEMIKLAADDPINPETGNRYEAVIIDRQVTQKQGNDMTIKDIIEASETISGLGQKLTWFDVFPTLTPRGGDRVNGWVLFHEYLRWTKDMPPKILFFNWCPEAIRTIPTLIHDTHNPEDLDTDGEDHAADSIRLLLSYLHEGKSDAPLSPLEQSLEQLRKKESPQYNPNSYYSI